MIDIETRRIVDLLESRELKEVSIWLKSYPNLQIISRDGSDTYAKAIRESHPNASQVSDRFHLLKNLTDYAKAYLMKMLHSKVLLE